MKIMVVGGGGREHAIIKKLKENKEITEIFALPGNGGMANDATLINIAAKDISAIVDFAKNNKINVIAGGHYQTETFGVNLVMNKLTKDKKIMCEFIDCPTGL